VTEAGETHITVQLLLDLIADTIRQSAAVGEFSTVGCSYICGSLDLLQKQGFIELEETKKPGRGSPAVTETPKDPPKFMLDAYKEKDGGADGATGL
jgi:hypothetical protein